MSLLKNGTSDASKAKVIMVTSAIPAEGKTSLALALARTYTMAGKSALLLDADLRKPSLHKYLDLKPEYSFLDYLSRTTPPAESQAPYSLDPKSNVGVFLGTRNANIPTDQLLQSNQFKELLASACDAMDVVILDTSPLIPVVDARYVASKADVVVVCVRSGVTSQSDLRLAYSQLASSVQSNTPILTVLSMDESKISGYRYDGYYTDYVSE